MADRVTLEVSRDGWTNGLQVSINLLDEQGGGHGYRIAGPKFNGSSETLLTEVLDGRDAEEIRRYLQHIDPDDRGYRHDRGATVSHGTGE